MCLFVKTKDYNPRGLSMEGLFNKYKKVVKRQKIVYKVVSINNKISKKSPSKYFSPHQCFEYDLGFHYYQTGNPINRFSFLPGVWFTIHEGLHAYTTLEEAQQMKKVSSNYAIIKCTIPKDSIYFLGYNNDIVTDNLILVEEI